MVIADSQVHIWADNSPERPWVGREPHHPEALTARKLLKAMDEAGVDRAILVPPSWDKNRNDLVIDASQEHPDRFRAMGRLNLEKTDAIGRVPAWTEQPGMLGLRCSFNRPAWRRLLEDGRADRLFAAAEAADVPIMTMLTHAQMPAIDGVAERHPGLSLSICHCALSSSKKGTEAFAELDKLLAVARRPNVTVKVSALPSYAADDYPYKSLHPYLRRIYDAFGPERMFWGTDLMRLPCSYRQAVTVFTEEMPFFTSDDLDWIMGRGLCTWLDWEMPQQ
jgi:predicted TIM-barrel fold metal-dependent hydrolase